MKFKKFDSEKDALNFSEQECKKNGCDGVTKYLYSVIEAIDGWYVIINDGANIEGATEDQPQWIEDEERPTSE